MAFSKIFVAAVAVLSLATSISAAPIPKPWNDNEFEPYDEYHTRYLALQCQTKHNTDFFSLCCGPLENGQALSTRPAECNPDSAATPAPTQGEDDDDNCTDDDQDNNDQDNNDQDNSDQDNSDQDNSDQDNSDQDNSNQDNGDQDNGEDNSDNTTVTTLNPTPTTTTEAPSSTPNEGPANTPDGSVHTGGHGTWFTQNGVAGACGQVHSDSDLIGAMNYQLYGDMSQESSLCGKQVSVTNTANQKQVTIVIADACPSCPGQSDIDLSMGAFEQLSDLDTGLIDIVWSFVN